MNSLIRQSNFEKTERIDFEEIVQKYGVMLYKYLFSLVRHKELAEDLYQEVLISAYLGLSSIKEGAKLRSWLFKIATNKCRDYWRKEKLTKIFWEEKVQLYYTDETNPPPLPEEMLLHKCTRDEITEMISELPEIYQEPLLLFYYGERSLIEISHDTKLPLSTIKTRMKRGKDQLRPKVKRIM
ncbi:RNA polymerase sigma factor [Bacillus sp. V3B]|uniref:RNA polymerase sigma factor n=1 Tax=Bacillus sp. V3B TaxID=2804915 RepID=UPI00210AB71C|nr:RNA polymerase sigma factor [Bacillus sp. V3B]